MRILIICLLLLSSTANANDFGKRDENQHSMITALKAYAVYKMGQYDEAYDLWLPLAEKGNTTAMVNIAAMYVQGQGREIDIDKARYWLEKAAVLGDERAIEELESLKNL